MVFSDTALVVANDLVMQQQQSGSAPSTANVTLQFTSSGGRVTLSGVPIAATQSQFALGSTVAVSFAAPSTSGS